MPPLSRVLPLLCVAACSPAPVADVVDTDLPQDSDTQVVDTELVLGDTDVVEGCTLLAADHDLDVALGTFDWGAATTYDPPVPDAVPIGLTTWTLTASPVVSVAVGAGDSVRGVWTFDPPLVITDEVAIPTLELTTSARLDAEDVLVIGQDPQWVRSGPVDIERASIAVKLTDAPITEVGLEVIARATRPQPEQTLSCVGFRVTMPAEVPDGTTLRLDDMTLSVRLDGDRRGVTPVRAGP